MTKAVYQYLGEQAHLIPTIAQWHQDEWHNISPNLTTDLRINEYSSYPCKPNIPMCILATVDGKAAGSASLVLSDMDTHPELSPWLASVYVSSDYRCQGIATELIQQCINNARLLGIEKLYLFKPTDTAVP